MRFKGFLSGCIWALFSLVLTMIAILGIVYTYMEVQLPNVKVLNDIHMQVPLRIYSSDGKLIAQYGAKKRIPVALNQVPKPLIDAVVATEDARFYSHPGVDFIGLIRAARAVILSGRKVQGASTITMQVARNFFLTRKKTYTRKIKEILLALKIDKELSKDKILELYLNKVYFGHRAYGVAAAAEVYYGKKLNQLTLPEMAMIAGLPQAPSRNNPLSNPGAAMNRRNHVLYRMYKVGFIDEATYLEAIKAPMTAKYHEKKVSVYAPYIAEMVRQVLVSELGKSAYDSGFSIYTTLSSRLQGDANLALHNGLIAYSERHGYQISQKNLGIPSADNLEIWQLQLKKIPKVLNLVPAAVLELNNQSAEVLLANGQTITLPWSAMSWARPSLGDGLVGRKPQQASDILNIGDVIWLRKDSQQQWRLTQIPKAQGALVAMNPQNGAILALTGGFDYDLSKFNRATQAQRQPGSNFKPFIYSGALAKGYTLASIINDAPIVIRDTGENRLWRPANDTMKFYGPTRLRVGLTKSRNLVSVRLLRRIGIRYALNYVSRFGFNPNKLPHSLSLALGSGLVTPLQISAGYSVFANGGYRVTPHYIEKIVGQNNKIIYQAKNATACEACLTNPNPPAEQIPTSVAPSVLNPQNVYIMTQALRGVIQTGTGRAARVLRRPDLAGKTGTTNNQVDAWFSGFNSNIETTIWVGFDDSSQSLHEYGSQAALPIWIEFMRDALRDTPEATMPQPPGIVTARIDPRTGLLAPASERRAIFEVFREKFQPKHYANAAATPLYSSPTFATSSTVSSSSSDDSSDQPLF